MKKVILAIAVMFNSSQLVADEEAVGFVYRVEPNKSQVLFTNTIGAALPSYLCAMGPGNDVTYIVDEGDTFTLPVGFCREIEASKELRVINNTDHLMTGTFSAIRVGSVITPKTSL